MWVWTPIWRLVSAKASRCPHSVSSVWLISLRWDLLCKSQFNSSNNFQHLLIVQHECIPQALLGMDIICQAKSGMGKTAVFVLATLHQLQPTDGEVHVLVLCHTRELAFQIQREYERFSKYLPDVKSRVFYGGKISSPSTHHSRMK